MKRDIAPTARLLECITEAKQIARKELEAGVPLDAVYAEMQKAETTVRDRLQALEAWNKQQPQIAPVSPAKPPAITPAKVAKSK